MERTPDAIDSKPSDSSKASRTTKADRELLTRIYHRPEYTAIARAIGAESWDIEDARDLIVPLMKRFGVQRITAITEELVLIQPTRTLTFARLKENVRRFASQLIGPASAIQADDSNAELTLASELPRRRLARLKLLDSAEVSIAADYVPVEARRADVVQRFATHLTHNEVPFHAAKDVELFHSTAKRPVAFDFLIERGSERQITLVRREISKTIRARLGRLLKQFGPDYVGVRVWPIQAERAWMWEKEWILSENEPPPSRSGHLVEAPREGECTTATQSGPTVQLELF